MAFLQQARTEPKPATPSLAPSPTKFEVYRAGAAGHLYRLGDTDAEGGDWRVNESVAFVDGLMAFRLRLAAPRWGVTGDGYSLGYNDGSGIHLRHTTDIQPPDQIGSLYIVLSNDVPNLVAQCAKIISRGDGVEVRIEALI